MQSVGHEGEEHAEGDGQDTVREKMRDEGAADNDPPVEHRAIVASDTNFLATTP